MPSIKLELGKYVTLRPRADGTYRVFFQVPERLRPDGWPSLIPLPVNGERRGELSDAGEVRRIQGDAKTLYAQLVAARLGRVEPAGRSLLTLVRSWQQSTAYKAIRARTAKSYSTYVNHLLFWSETVRPQHPDPGKLTRGQVDDLLSGWDVRPSTKRNVRKVLRLLMEHAIALGWRIDNPCDGIRIRQKRVKGGVWEAADVEAYAAAALACGQPAISLIIRLEWEIGQRLGDVRTFRPGVEYDRAAGAFSFDQSKTDEAVTVMVSDALRDALAEAGDGQMFMFHDGVTQKAFTEERLSKAFATVRAKAKEGGARYLQLKWLRHSCVVHLARAGCTVPEIAAITGHSPASATKILATYLPRDSSVARAAQVKRGLVKEQGGPEGLTAVRWKV